MNSPMGASVPRLPRGLRVWAARAASSTWERRQKRFQTTPQSFWTGTPTVLLLPRIPFGGSASVAMMF